jgi:hypothetical protein
MRSLLRIPIDQPAPRAVIGPLQDSGSALTERHRHVVLGMTGRARALVIDSQRLIGLTMIDQ